MNKNSIPGRIIIVAIVLTACASASAQTLSKPVKGIVIDSISFAPLPGVNIQIKHTNRGTSTDNKGEFRLLVHKTDTLIFSLVGYHSDEFPVADLDETTLIRMAEEIRLLQTIKVMPRPDEVKPLVLNARPKGGLNNLSPLTTGVNLAYFSRLEREKRKLTIVKNERARQQNYIAVVTSPEVRERIIYDYHLTEDEYYEILAGFNIENGDSLYGVSSEELISIMNQYFKRYGHQR